MLPLLKSLILIACLFSFVALADAAQLQWDRNSELDVHHYEMYQCDVVNCDPYPAPPAVPQRLGTDIPQPTVTTVKPSMSIPVGESGRAAVIAVDLVGNKSFESNIVPFRGQPLNAPSGLQQIP